MKSIPLGPRGISMDEFIYKASIIGIQIMLALNNINYKATIIGILIKLALNNINCKA